MRRCGGRRLGARHRPGCGEGFGAVVQLRSEPGVPGVSGGTGRTRNTPSSTHHRIIASSQPSLYASSPAVDNVDSGASTKAVRWSCVTDIYSNWRVLRPALTYKMRQDSLRHLRAGLYPPYLCVRVLPTGHLHCPLSKQLQYQSYYYSSMLIPFIKISVMLLLHTLVLFLLSISAMATPLLNRRRLPLSAEQKFSLSDVSATVTLKTYRGLWKTVNIPLLILPHTNLIYYLAGIW